MKNLKSVFIMCLMLLCSICQIGFTNINVYANENEVSTIESMDGYEYFTEDRMQGGCKKLEGNILVK